MGLTGMVLMWVVAGLAFVVVSRWSGGKEGDQRTKYWEKYER